MDIKSILVYVFFMIHIVNATNVNLTEWYGNFNNNINEAFKYGGELTKKPKSELIVRPTRPTSKPVYESEKPVNEKQEKKPELKEICTLTLRKSDIVMLTLVKKATREVSKPIMIDPSSLELSFAVHKHKKLAALLGMVKSKKHFGVNEFPINLQVDPKVLHELPPSSSDDVFILTIIREATKKRPEHVVSHFVDKISVAPITVTPIHKSY